MADDCNQIALATAMYFQDGKAILGIVEGDALDRACEGLQVRLLVSLRGSRHPVHGACRA
jgi:hypothetical protein